MHSFRLKLVPIITVLYKENEDKISEFRFDHQGIDFLKS